MRTFLTILSLLLAAVVQSLLPAWSALGNVKPPVLACVVLYYALRCEKRELMRVVLLAAVLHDGLDLSRPPIALLAFPAVAWLAHAIRFEVFPDEWITQLLMGAAGALLVLLFASTILTLTKERPYQPATHHLMRFVGALLSGMITLPVVSQLLMRAEAPLPRRREIRWK